MSIQSYNKRKKTKITFLGIAPPHGFSEESIAFRGGGIVMAPCPRASDAIVEAREVIVGACCVRGRGGERWVWCNIVGCFRVVRTAAS